MTADLKVLKVKMRGPRGSAKTEFLTTLARIAESFGMTAVLEGDGHNMAVTSTKEQRLALYAFNRQHAPVDHPAHALMPDGDVA